MIGKYLEAGLESEEGDPGLERGDPPVRRALEAEGSNTRSWMIGGGSMGRRSAKEAGIVSRYGSEEGR